MNTNQSDSIVKAVPIRPDLRAFSVKPRHMIILVVMFMALFMSVNISLANTAPVSGLGTTRASESSVRLNWTNNVSLPAGLDIQLTWFFRPHEDLERISEHFDLFVLTKNFERERDRLAQMGNSPILQYITVDSIDDPCFQARNPVGSTCSCDKTPRNNNVGWNAEDICWIRDNHNDWFLRDANGQLIYSGYGGSNNPYIVLDPGKQGWREFFLARVRDSQENLGWHGIFLDNLGEIFTAHTGNPVALRDYPTDQSYQDAMVGFLRYIRSNYFAPQGRPMFANFSALWDRGPAYYRYLEQLDGVMDEYWAVTKTNYYPILSFEKRLEGAVNTQNLGKTMMLVSQGGRNDFNRQRFSLATYLLVATDKAYFRYTQATSGGYSEIWLYDNYNTYLGDPTGTYYRQGDKFYRDFTHGRVMVDPLGRQSSITVNEIGVEVERSTDGGNTFTRIARVNPTATSYTDNNARGNVCYRVRYVNGSERSAFTNNSCVDGSGGTTNPPATPDATSTTITAPTGTVNTPRPTYRWRPISGATQYEIWVGRADNSEALYRTVNAADACNNTTCSLDASSINAEALVDGTYSVYVRGRVNNRWGVWNGPQTFSVNSPPAATPTLSQPTNTNSLTPTLVWNAGNGSSWFQVYLAPTNDLTAPAVQVWVDRNEVCTGNDKTNCSLNLSDALQPGTEYSLYIQAWGPGGFSTGGVDGWAGPVKFTTPGGAPPPGDAPVNLSVEVQDGRVVVVMPNDNSVKWFHIYVGTADGSWSHIQWYEKTSSMCSGNRCAILTDAHPSNGNYVVYVQTWGTNGFSTGGIEGWAGPANFRLNLPAPTTVRAMNQHTDEARPRFGWDKAEGATWYQLRLTNGADEIIHEQWFSSVEATCHNGSTRCVVRPEVSLTSGQTYRWTVRVWGPGGFGPHNDGNNWSEIRSFTP